MNRLQKFMMGRYGTDELSTGLLILSLILSFALRRFNGTIFQTIQTIVLILPLYRILSKDINRRYQENLKFLKIWNPIKRKINNIIRRIKDFKDYRYFKCTNCKQTLRIPKGKGRVSVTCPKCKIVVIKKS